MVLHYGESRRRLISALLICGSNNHCGSGGDSSGRYNIGDKYRR